MQKLDFVNNLTTIVEKLYSQEIVNQFNAGFSQPGTPGRYDLINALLFKSKSNYDRMQEDPQLNDILVHLNGSSIYSDSNLAGLTTHLRQVLVDQIYKAVSPMALYNFHQTLLNTRTLAAAVLTKNIDVDLEDSLKKGILILQIVIEGEGLETNEYIKIFTALQELISVISKIHGESEIEQEIVLLDSGSDTNLGVKCGIDTAKSLFSIFKEVWDFIANHKQYKFDKANKALMDSLTIRGKIQESVESKILTEEEGREYTHLIKTRTDSLIGMNVLPKQIAMESSNIENRKLLSNYEGLKMLGEPE